MFSLYILKSEGTVPNLVKNWPYIYNIDINKVINKANLCRSLSLEFALHTKYFVLSSKVRLSLIKTPKSLVCQIISMPSSSNWKLQVKPHEQRGTTETHEQGGRTETYEHMNRGEMKRNAWIWIWGLKVWDTLRTRIQAERVPPPKKWRKKGDF